MARINIQIISAKDFSCMISIIFELHDLLDYKILRFCYLKFMSQNIIVKFGWISIDFLEGSKYVNPYPFIGYKSNYNMLQ